MDREEIYLNILKENWLHARHIETERMWFANIYAVIIAAITAYITQHSLESFSIATLKLLVIVLLAISLIWFLITIKLNAACKARTNAIKKMYTDKKISLGADWKLYTGLPHSKLLPVSILLLLFYGLASVGLIYAIVRLFQGSIPFT